MSTVLRDYMERFGRAVAETSMPILPGMCVLRAEGNNWSKLVVVDKTDHNGVFECEDENDATKGRTRQVNLRVRTIINFEDSRTLATLLQECVRVDPSEHSEKLTTVLTRRLSLGRLEGQAVTEEDWGVGYYIGGNIELLIKPAFQTEAEALVFAYHYLQRSKSETENQ